MKCEDCKIEYPTGLVHPLVSGEATVMLCGICALDLTNKLRGLSAKLFLGPQAEATRLAAVAYRKQIGWVKP